jgi:cysteine desulfurase
MAALDVAGNPSSVHAEGRAARALIEDAREKVARLVGARPDDVVFTSGATEANNWVLRRSWRSILFSDIEHTSVRAPCLGAEGRLVRLPAGRNGAVEVDAALALIADLARDGAANGGLLTLQSANNETGVVQPLAPLAAAARQNGLKVFTDAVQAAGKMPLDVVAMDVDYLSLSAHKIGGPKGIGILYARDDATDGRGLPPLMLGGGQERRRRGGTENVLSIAGFGAAADAALKGLAQMERQRRLRDRMEREIVAATPEAVVIGSEAERLANTTCVALPGRKGSELIIALDLAGIAASAGSACSSGKVAASHVLAAMGIEPELAQGAVRLSIGPTTTEQDIDRLIGAWRTLARPRSYGTTANRTLSAQASESERRTSASVGDR